MYKYKDAMQREEHYEKKEKKDLCLFIKKVSAYFPLAMKEYNIYLLNKYLFK